MKIGVLTFHRALNLGGCLQTYALQYVLNNNGLKAEVVDYRSRFIEKQYDNNYFSYKKIKKLIHSVLFNGVIINKRVCFDNFIKDYVNVSAKVFNCNNINDANKYFDFFIAGSDQIWNIQCSGNDKNYFLDFSNKPNISYAASAGTVNLNKADKVFFNKYLYNFNFISVRESGLKYSLNDLNIESTAVLDPTLLIDKEVWIQNFNISAGSEKYILVYLIQECKETLEYAKKLAKKNGYSVKYINEKIYKYPGVENLNMVSPDNFVSLISNSTTVITNSFHGMCFSLIFEKNFYVNLLKSNKRVNDRLTEFLDMFEIQSQRLDYSNLDPNVVDFHRPTQILKDNRKKSLSILFSNIQKAK